MMLLRLIKFGIHSLLVIRIQLLVGPKIENYYMHATTPSIYKPVFKQFKLGGNSAAYGASTDTGRLDLNIKLIMDLV